MSINQRFWQELVHHTEQENLPWVSAFRKDSNSLFPFTCKFQLGILPHEYFDIYFNWDGYNYGVWLGDSSSSVYVPQYHWRYTQRLKSCLAPVSEPRYSYGCLFGDVSLFVKEAYRYFEVLLEEEDKAA